VLTTNVLDYNMATKVGTYVDGGKIVSKDVTLTSKNGYYFSNSRDSYFRYNVVVVTPDVTIKSDTLRYNTFTNWTYFYGPTNIKGKDDNLYTENGAYNTKSEYAYFGKKNLYTQGSKSMKGDSLYYDGIAGYGKAVRNIVFIDTTDKTVLHGQLGYYYKQDQRTLVTKNPYIGMGTKDSTKVRDVMRPDTLWLGADTLETQMVLRQTLTLIPRTVIKKDNEVGSETDSTAVGTEKKVKVNQLPKVASSAKVEKPADNHLSRKQKKELARKEKEGKLNTDSIPIVTDSLAKIPIAKADSLLKKTVVGTDSLVKGAPPGAKGITDGKVASAVKVASAGKVAPGTKVAPGAKVTTEAKASLGAKASPGAKVETSAKATAGAKVTASNKVSSDSEALKRSPALKGAVDSANIKSPKTDSSTLAAAKKSAIKLKTAKPINPLDTVTARVIKAYHHVRVYKSNLQAKSDSLFYTSADSTLRWYSNPMMWGQGSQQTGDTIYLQMKNSKLSAVEVIQTAFSVNVEKDSTRFNQVKGKKMTGFFKDGKVNTMYVDGNAESIYFTKDEKGAYKEMNQTVSSRLKITFQNGAIADMLTIRDAESAITPIAQLKENVMLTGFIWKPELRPTSKRDIINPKAIKVVKKPAAKTASTKKTEATKGKKTTAPGKPGEVIKPPAEAPNEAITETPINSKADSTSIKVVPATLRRDSTAAGKKILVKP
jgi:lipopolysaccharide export system protein LptA